MTKNMKQNFKFVNGKVPRRRLYHQLRSGRVSCVLITIVYSLTQNGTRVSVCKLGRCEKKIHIPLGIQGSVCGWGWTVLTPV